MLCVFLLKSPNTLFFLATISLSTSLVALSNPLPFTSKTFNDLFMLFTIFSKDAVEAGFIFSISLKLSDKLVIANFISFELLTFVVCDGNFETAVVMLVAISLSLFVFAIALSKVCGVSFNLPNITYFPLLSIM